MRLIWIGLAGGLGSVCRYLMVRSLTPTDVLFPFGTFAVNILGCFAIGLLAALITNEELRFALITGLLGGFTTFSAFSMETVHLLRAGAVVTAALYVLASTLGGVTAAWVGWRAGH